MPKSPQIKGSNNLLESLTYEILVSLTETKLRKEIIIPLLEEIGAERVIDMHGSDEEGIDVYFEYCDIFEHKKRFGIQIKKGNLKYESKTSKKNVLTIVNQIQMGFSKEIRFIDSEIGKASFMIDGYYVIISGEATAPAKEIILRERRLYPYIHIIEGDGLIRLVQNREILKQRFSIFTTRSKAKS